MSRRLFLIIICFVAVAVVAVAQNISGQVIDQATGDSIPFATVKYRGSRQAVVCNHAGRFSIERMDGRVLVFSSVGYKTRRVQIDGGMQSGARITLEPDSKQLDEFTFKSKRRKYKRKENPAVELMRRVIAAKKRTDLANHDYYEYHNYQKITLAINDLKPDDLEKGLFKKQKWMTSQVEFCPQNNKLIMPLSVDETVTRHVYRKSPHSEKEIIEGQKSEGINHVLQTGEILNTVAKDAFTDIDLYDDQIRLLRHPFTSPIGKDAIGFYRFYIADTVFVGKDKCFHLEFVPNNQQDIGFRGELYILADTTLHVKKCNMMLPQSSGVNYVDNLWVEQEYSQLDNGEWALTKDDMVIELSIVDFLTKALVVRTTRKSDYSFGNIPNKLFRGKVAQSIDPDAAMRKDDFWNKYRTVELTRSERSMSAFIKRMRQAKDYKFFLAAFKILMENFIETGNEAHPSKVDIGPVNTFVSHNFIDGIRLRGSLQTTANLNPHLFFKGYYAHGLKSNKNYYKTTLVYSLNKKNYTYDEFPKRNITLESTYDVYNPSDKFLTTDKDNVFTAVKWAETDKMMFYNRQRVQFEYETDYGLSMNMALKTEGNEACGRLRFLGLDSPYTEEPTSSGSLHNGKIRTTDFTLSLRYAPGEKYMNTKQRRILVNKDAPVFTLSHSFGVRGLLGGEYSYNITELGIHKRLWLNSWGKLEVDLRGGVQWNQVPFPLLIIPAANLSYIATDNMFSMINNMEFLNDRYASLQLAWDMKGKLFNRIPLFRRLKWRENIGFKSLWGTLSSKNNPALQENAGNARLMYFPAGTYTLEKNKPYAELFVGVHNIFKILQVQYVRRLNYTDLPTASKNGVRLMFNFTF